MSKKKNVFSNPAFHNQPENSSQFNLIAETSSFESFFQVKDLDPRERNDIEKIIVEYYIPNIRSDQEAASDVAELSQMTAEIKAIGKQGLLLIGERVAKARQILKSYRDGAFTKWLEGTFGSIRTGYNMLGYYELYHALPEDILRDKYKKIPQKAAYILASRTGDITLKADIIREYHDLSADEFIMLIKEKLPTDFSDNRRGKSVNKRLIDALVVVVKRIQKRKDSLSVQDRKALEAVRIVVDNLLVEEVTLTSSPS